MPGTVNGIGTKFYGKGNLKVTVAHCDNCQAKYSMETYDTYEYFTLLYIPVIPLKKLHIINECTRCRRFRMVSSGKWKKQMERSVSVIESAIETGKDTEAVLLAELPAFGMYNDKELFESVAVKVLQWNSTAPVYSLLGNLFRYYHHAEGYLTCMKKAVELNKTDEYKILLAEAFLYNDSPEQAEPLISFLFESSNNNDFWVVSLLIQSYLTKGNYRKAEQLVEKLKATYTTPMFESPTKELALSVKKCSESSQPYYSSSLAMIKEPFLTQSKPVSKAPMLIAPIVLLLAMMLYFYTAFTTADDNKVYIINGTARSYEVTIDGVDFRIPAFSKNSTNLDMGTHTITMDSPSEELRSQEFEISTPFWTRPFDDIIFVINPDRQAIIYSQKIVYTTSQNNVSDYPYTIFAGELLYSFKNIDYEFRSGPQQISTSGGDIKKMELRMINDFTPEWTPINLAMRELSGEKFTDFLQFYIAENPNDYSAISMNYQILGEEQFFIFAEPYLAANPANVEFHRIYQELIEVLQPKLNIVETYETRLELYPQDAMNYYLLGRVCSNERSQELNKQAILIDSLEAYPYYSLAYHARRNGKFNDALRYVQKARELEKDNIQFTELEVEIHWALENYSEVLNISNERLLVSNFSVNITGDKVLSLAKKDEIESANSTIENYMDLRREEHDPNLSEYSNYFNMMKAIGQNKSDDILRFCSDLPGYEVEAAILNGDVVGADEEFGKKGNAYRHLMLYSFAQKKNSTTIAQKHLESAIAVLNESNIDEQLFARALSGESFSFEELNDANVYPEHKAIFLTALGFTNTNYSRTAFREAKKNNYVPSINQIIINTLI